MFCGIGYWKKPISFDIFAKGLWLNLLLLVQSLLFCGDLMYGESFADKNFSGRILCSGTSNASKRFAAEMMRVTDCVMWSAKWSLHLWLEQV